MLCHCNAVADPTKSRTLRIDTLLCEVRQQRGELSAAALKPRDYEQLQNHFAEQSGMIDYLAQAHSLLRVGGVVLADNVLWSGDVINPDDASANTEAIRGFNASLKNDARFHVSMVPVGDGITIAVKV